MKLVEDTGKHLCSQELQHQNCALVVNILLLYIGLGAYLIT